MLRLWKLAAKLQRGGVCVCVCWEGRIDPDSWEGGRGRSKGRGRELSGIMGYGDDKRRDSVELSTPSQGPTRGGLPARASWGHPGTRSARHIKSASPCMEPFVQQNPAWPASPPLTRGASHRTQLISKHLMSLRQENRPPAQPACSPPPPSSRGAWRRHFTRTDDAAKTTIMIINLLNLEDYAVN